MAINIDNWLRAHDVSPKDYQFFLDYTADLANFLTYQKPARSTQTLLEEYSRWHDVSARLFRGVTQVELQPGEDPAGELPFIRANLLRNVTHRDDRPAYGTEDETKLDRYFCGIAGHDRLEGLIKSVAQRRAEGKSLPFDYLRNVTPEAVHQQVLHEIDTHQIESDPDQKLLRSSLRAVNTRIYENPRHPVHLLMDKLLKEGQPAEVHAIKLPPPRKPSPPGRKGGRVGDLMLFPDEKSAHSRKGYNQLSDAIRHLACAIATDAAGPESNAKMAEHVQYLFPGESAEEGFSPLMGLSHYQGYLRAMLEEYGMPPKLAQTCCTDLVREARAEVGKEKT